jgi:uncharacterized Zn finger protein
VSRRRRLPRHLLEPGAGGRQARAPRRGAVEGPIAEAWLAAVESVLAPATRTIARRRLATAHTRRATLMPGSVRVEIRQTSYRNHIVSIRIPEVDESGWDALIAAAAVHGRWLAALAAGELPDDLAGALVDAGIIPGGETLRSECTCRTEVGLCVHAAIAAHVVAAALTAEPAGILTLRGMAGERLRERVERQLPGNRATSAARDPATMDWNALVLGPQAPLPEPLDLPAHAERPATLPAPPPASGVRSDELDALAADAAARAFGLLTGSGDGDGGLDLDADADLARRAAGMSPGELTALAGRTQSSEEELTALASAWRIGGAGAVAALCRPWRALPRTLEPGIEALQGIVDGDVSWRLNRVTGPDGRIELALGRDGLWYLLRRERRSASAFLDAPGAADPLLLTGGQPQPRPQTEGPPDAVAEQLRLL